MKIWVLTDNRAGNNSQTLAVAAELGKFTEKKISYSKLAELPNFVFGKSLAGISGEISPPYPDLVISAGRKLARVAAHIKRKSGCKAVQIMWPGKSLVKNFDLVIIPEHDRFPNSANIFKITGSVAACPKAKSSDLTKYLSTPGKKIAVLLGSMTETEAEKFAEKLNRNRGSYFITTSRRTSDLALNVFESKMLQPSYIYKYGSNKPNPYSDFLAGADIIIVSGDSASMCSEAASTGKPVYIFEVETKQKFRILHKKLYDLGIARKFKGKLESWKYKKLNNPALVKKEIQNRLK